MMLKECLRRRVVYSSVVVAIEEEKVATRIWKESQREEEEERTSHPYMMDVIISNPPPAGRRPALSSSCPAHSTESRRGKMLPQGDTRGFRERWGHKRNKQRGWDGQGWKYALRRSMKRVDNHSWKRDRLSDIVGTQTHQPPAQEPIDAACAGYNDWFFGEFVVVLIRDEEFNPIRDFSG